MKKFVFPVECVFQTTDGSGKPKTGVNLANSAEEIRCMLLATVIVFARHRRRPLQHRVTVQLTDECVRSPDHPARELDGIAYVDAGLMRLLVRQDPQDTLTTLIHEYLHLIGFDSEWVVSTLTHRFKPEIATVAAVLLKGYYQGAAFLAHTKPGMAYPEGEQGDVYNDQQWLPVDVDWTKRR